MAKNKTAKDLGLKVNSAVEIMSYVINSDPTLSAEIDLPVQGDPNALPKLGELVSSNQRFKNAFLNTVNMIALTVIRDNTWRNPWDEFTEKGVFRYGDSVRELFVDLANVYDYHEYENDVDHFLENVVPNIYNYIHVLNYEKFYKTSTSDEQIAMAFTSEEEFFSLINKVIGSLYEGYQYDKYIVEKYMLCRRALDGTMTPAYISNYDSLSTREVVALMKGYSNDLIFPDPRFNPAGVRSHSRFEDQYLIMDNKFEGAVSTEVLATSYFRNDAEFKTNAALINGYGEHDTIRLAQVLGNSYKAFSSDDLALLNTIKGCIVDREFFQVYNKTFNAESEVRNAEFFNPETLKTNHWLHTKKIISTSPFAPNVLFTTTQPAVSAIAVSPSSATVSAGNELPLKAIVTATGFANKAVTWSVDSSAKADGVTIDVNGLLKVPADVSVDSITVTATSVFDTSITGTATISTASATIPSITSVTVSAAGSVTTIAASATLQMSADVVKVGNPSTSVEWSLDAAALADGFTISGTGLVTAPAEPTVAKVTVTATSIFDTTKSDDYELTVGS